MSKSSIPTDWHNCATCLHWTGVAIPNAFCSWVEFDTHDTGKCMGGGFHMCSMPPLSSCNKWEGRW